MHVDTNDFLAQNMKNLRTQSGDPMLAVLIAW